MRFRRLFLRSIVFVVFVAAAVVVLITGGTVLSSLATPPSPPRCVPSCLPDTDNTAPAMLAVGILMIVAGAVLVLVAHRMHRRDRARRDHERDHLW